MTKETKRVIREVLLRGSQLSNVAFNLKQDDKLSDHIRSMLGECQQNWDEAVKKLHNVVLGI